VQEHPSLEGVDSLVWFDEEPGRAGPGAALELRRPPPRIRSDAALAAGGYLGGGWAVLARLARLIPRALRDAVYDLVARNRHRVARTEACLLPSPEERARFLDGPDAAAAAEDLSGHDLPTGSGDSP
jgi:hypothetical protein